MVMKRTYIKLLLRGVKKTRARFLSIMAIVVVGVGFLAGLLATTPDMQLTADTYYDRNNMLDIDLQDYVFGFDKKDADTLKKLGYVDMVMPAYAKDIVAQTGGGTTVARVYGMPIGGDDGCVNGFELIEGELPDKGECLVAYPNGYSEQHGIGETVTVSPDTSDYDSIGDTLSFTSLKISGIVRSPYYMSIESESSLEGTGAVGIIVYVPYEMFTQENYNHIFLTINGARDMNCFSGEYQKLIDDAADKLKDFGKETVQVKRTDKINELNGRYDEAKDKLNTSKQEAKEQFDEAGRQIDIKKHELEEGRAAYEQQAEQLEQLRPTLPAEQYAALAEQLAQAQKQLDEGEKELAGAEAELNENRKKAEEEFDKAQADLDDLAGVIEDFPDMQWSVTLRSDTVSYASYKSNSEKVDAIAKVFPVFFFMVAALVALTTMTRMVEEERTQIGTLKALGYSKGSILFYYVGYSVLASLIGGIIGVVVGFYTLPLVISQAYGMMYTLPATQCAFYWGYVFLIIPVAVAITSLATLLACLGQLTERPSTLMLPRAPKPGKRILLERTFLWKHLSFSKKVTARNIFRYKKRLAMTIFGIAGCCALLLTGFGLRDSIHEIVDKQFGEIYRYNLTLALSDPAAVNEDETVNGILGDSNYIDSYAAVYNGSGKASANGVREKATLLVPKNGGELKKQINLRQRNSGEDIPFEADSVVLTEKLAETIGVSAGDTVTLTDSEGREAGFTVTGVCENYISGYVFIAPELYAQKFGYEPEYDVVLASTAERTQGMRDDLSKRLLSSDSVLLLRFSDTIRESFANTVKSMDSIVVVLIISAGLLAIIVLYNLTNINICERKKELATLKVLGFNDKETGAYIFRETTILCLMGIVFGFVLGIFLHAFVVRTAEVDAVMFGRNISWLSYVLSAVITMFFTVLVDIFMRKKVNSVDMVAAMKANE